jgi:hypothetical protein
MSRRPARCTQADIKRAIKAAEAAGAHMAVDILPDGTIRLTPTTPKTSESSEGPSQREPVL